MTDTADESAESSEEEAAEEEAPSTVGEVVYPAGAVGGPPLEEAGAEGEEAEAEE
jgi:hypothetical protein